MRFESAGGRDDRRGSGASRARPRRVWTRVALAALCLSVGLLVASLAPAGPTAWLTPIASAHALPIREDPASDAILQAPPNQVRMWFSEQLNPLTSHMVVVDTTNKEVDNRDSHVNGSDPTEMDVSLPLLKAGTYVVAWRTQSAVDGHIVGGSYIFRIARPDGSVPPVPAVLPTGHVPGGGGVGAPTSGGLDGPTWLQTVATWLALVFMAFWVGGLIWETWILPPVGQRDNDLAEAGRAAAQRFRRLAPWALGLLLLADVGLVLALAAEVAGDWSGLYSVPLLKAVVFGSKFGTFWWMRQLVAGAALVMALLSARDVAVADGWRRGELGGGDVQPIVEPTTPSGWVRWTLAAIPAAPRAFVRGLRRRSLWGYVELALGAALLVAFALSGHAAAVIGSELPYALSVDLLHLLGTAAWVGGVMYIAAVLVPALRQLPSWQRAAVLARGLPHFSALAIITFVVLAATGTLNTTIHLTSALQFLTTTYGRTLAVKIELFLIMGGLSAYHAFRLRPRLARALGADGIPIGVASDSAATEANGAKNGATRAVKAAKVARAIDGVAVGRSISASAQPAAESWSASGYATAGDQPAPESRTGERGAPTSNGDEGRETTPAGETGGAETTHPRHLGAEAARLASALEEWLRREAALGVAVLFCVALLAAFAGSLTPAAASSSSSGGSSSGPYVSAPQTVGGLTVVLKVAPAAFGTNTFTVTVHDASGKPVAGAGVVIVTTMLDMDMGVQTTQIQAGSTPGVYSGQADLTMAGHWDIKVKVLPAKSNQYQIFDFKLTAGY